MPTTEPDRLELANLPTPLVPLDRLSQEFEQADIWMKRDDLTGVELTGNKIRKLEYIVADALANGHDTIVTEGTCQSNHCRATAAVCARLGLHCTLLVRPPAPDTIPQGNHLLSTLFGAELRSYERARFDSDHDQIIAEVVAELRAAGHLPRYTPMGASEPLGCWGYIRALRELAAQLTEADIESCDLVTAVSSGATYAGLLLAREMDDLQHVHIWGVPVSEDIKHHRGKALDLCAAASAQFGLGVDIDESMLNLIDGYVGDGYAIPYEEALRAIRLLAHTEGLVTEPVYTAKALAAFLDGVRDGRFGRQRPAIFLHTGGAPSAFAWPELLVQGVTG